LGGEELNAIGLAQVTEGIMGSDDAAIARRQGAEPGFGFGQQAVDLFQIGLAVALVIGLVGRVGRYQGLGVLFT
jgi:hypothetical protein